MGVLLVIVGFRIDLGDFPTDSEHVRHDREIGQVFEGRLRTGLGLHRVKIIKISG